MSLRADAVAAAQRRRPRRRRRRLAEFAHLSHTRRGARSSAIMYLIVNVSKLCVFFHRGRRRPNVHCCCARAQKATQRTAARVPSRRTVAYVRRVARAEQFTILRNCCNIRVRVAAAAATAAVMATCARNRLCEFPRTCVCVCESVFVCMWGAQYEQTMRANYQATTAAIQ